MTAPANGPRTASAPALRRLGPGVVIMDIELTMALQTIGDRACFDNEADADHAYRSEVARWLTLT